MLVASIFLSKIVYLHIISSIILITMTIYIYIYIYIYGTHTSKHIYTHVYISQEFDNIIFSYNSNMLSLVQLKYIVFIISSDL